MSYNSVIRDMQEAIISEREERIAGDKQKNDNATVKCLKEIASTLTDIKTTLAEISASVSQK